MGKVKYFKRHRMEVPLRPPHAPADLPTGFRWLAWADALLSAHAEVKYLSFHQHEDALVFPSLGTRAGCHDLMHAIRFRPNFCAAATWLAVGPDGAGAGTIQGLIDENGYGGIQNLGVVPECRGLGLGRALLLRALAGFAAAGAPRAFLEVTAANEPAVRMYRSVGFRAFKTIYRAVEVPHADPVGAGL
jgi:ribosomal protein S18 acetylase RimI-like enzyme